MRGSTRHGAGARDAAMHVDLLINAQKKLKRVFNSSVYSTTSPIVVAANCSIRLLSMFSIKLAIFGRRTCSTEQSRASSVESDAIRLSSSAM